MSSNPEHCHICGQQWFEGFTVTICDACGRPVCNSCSRTDDDCRTVCANCQEDADE